MLLRRLKKMRTMATKHQTLNVSGLTPKMTKTMANVPILFSAAEQPLVDHASVLLSILTYPTQAIRADTKDTATPRQSRTSISMVSTTNTWSRDLTLAISSSGIEKLRRRLTFWKEMVKWSMLCRGILTSR